MLRADRRSAVQVTCNWLKATAKALLKRLCEHVRRPADDKDLGDVSKSLDLIERTPEQVLVQRMTIHDRHRRRASDLSYVNDFTGMMIASHVRT